MRKQVVGATVLSFLAGLSIKSSIASELDATTRFADSGVAYVERGNAASNYRLIFIHGSPGNKEGYEAYLKDTWLLENAELISVDRVGYGQSPEELAADLDSQSKSIESLLAKDKVNILIGHSLGGPIALNLALMFPNLVQGMVLVAPAFDPKLEEPKWYNELADTWLVSVFLSDNWKKSNGEMMPLADELSKLSNKDWGLLDSVPVTLIHGDEDNIADPENSAFAIQRLTGKEKKLVEVKGEGHFILWQNTPKVINEIKQLISIADLNRP
ncbi:MULTISPECIES: alpha/beta fold hydrolase [Vibrio]|uniref:Alpha/beta hydrolase n=1 Tax=Vibrio coralliilyticus TaxID=190893 RepID=A0AAN0VWZ9_9VIBR|nr:MULTISPECIES: alpha/beta hydrolase [Vibrio]MCM5507430.1 alpha/beta hydrolase [Vibrio sp. SCSIO 43169]AIW18712.1 alpha/beta hydrolase [Vibrio coralliilyticus]EEX30954.1 alpha/beta hydrolase superfamily putative [Vibrio coralliilyticus ATCC BAA-450]MDE3896155.1 alpha/beta hydrolase [Vibrio sp. CC007]NOH39995.1 alpha/beta hydrolase [Vibrio coralliilyticus]